MSTLAKTRTLYARLSAHAETASMVDSRIRTQAQTRHDALTKRMDELRPGVLTNQEQADEYQRAVQERGGMAMLATDGWEDR